MRILSIETSCDDTALTIFEVKGGVQNATFKILANNTNSQINVHIPYGGVFPALAKREHEKNLPILLDACLKQAKLDIFKPSGKKKIIDAIVVTYGPGLEMSLWTGIVFAKELAQKWNVPLIPANHMEGHVLSVFGKDKGTFKISKLKGPILSLLVSGGHTQLVLTKKWMDYEIIGETLDDAVGEAFDKVARMMDLPYPGGPQISKFAEGLREIGKQGKDTEKSISKGHTYLSADKLLKTQPVGFRSPSGNYSPISLPRPMLYTKNFNFSFSGLKTAVLYLIRDLEKSGNKIDDKIKREIALEFENSAIECLTHKTAKAIEKYGVKTLIISGGVAANKHLRNEMKKLANADKKNKIKLMFPTPYLCTDNSIMIGIAGYLNYIKNKKKVPKPETIKATGNLKLGKA